MTPRKPMMMHNVSYFCTKMHHFKAKKSQNFFTHPLVAFGHSFVSPILNSFPRSPEKNEIPWYGPETDCLKTSETDSQAMCGRRYGRRNGRQPSIAAVDRSSFARTFRRTRAHGRRRDQSQYRHRRHDDVTRRRHDTSGLSQSRHYDAASRFLPVALNSKRTAWNTIATGCRRNRFFPI